MITKFDEFKPNGVDENIDCDFEGLILEKHKIKTTQSGLAYRGETFSGYNIPKRYDGKQNFKYRVLAKDGDKTKLINFGKKNLTSEETKKYQNRLRCKTIYSKMSKKYWACRFS